MTKGYRDLLTEEEIAFLEALSQELEVSSSLVHNAAVLPEEEEYGNRIDEAASLVWTLLHDNS